MTTWREATAHDRSKGYVTSDGSVLVSNLESLQNKPQAGTIMQHENGTYTVVNDDDGQKRKDVPEEQVEPTLQELDIANSDWS